MITKDTLKDFALKYKQETGSFPKYKEWRKTDGFPCGREYVNSLFEGSYNNFREYCGEPILQRKKPITLDWIKENCTIDQNNCWNWNKAIALLSGYGSVGYEGKQWATHRLTYTLANGDIPEGLLVRHMCNNKKCCNPEHLKLGSHRENNLDTENYAKAFKLTREQVLQIKQEIENTDFSVRGSKRLFDLKWAKHFNVQQGTIESIRLGKTWTHL